MGKATISVFFQRIAAAFALSGLVLAGLTWLGLPSGHSALLNYPWSAQYAQAVSWHDPFPRYLPGLWSGFGGQDFFFYAPLPFWVTATIVAPLCPGCSAETEFVLGAALFLLASGFSMYAFLRQFFEVSAAAIGAAVFVVLPYHLLLDWFERQAVGEFTAYAFLPLIALGVERLRRNKGGGAILALAVAGTALSHLPTMLLAAHALAPLCLLFAALEQGGARAKLLLFARYFCFASLGLGIAAFYWLPAVALIDTVSPGVLFSPYFEASGWLYGSGVAQPNPGFARTILIAFLACAPLLLISVLRSRGVLWLWIAVPTCVALVLNLGVSAPIWRNWIISAVQFPWRLMSIVDLATATAAAALVAGVIRGDRARWAALAFALALGPYALLATDITFRAGEPASERYRDWVGAHEYMSPEMTEAVRTRLDREWLSHFDLRATADTTAEMAQEMHAELSRAEVIDRRARAMTIMADPDAAVVSLPVQYWFLWQAETNAGVALELRANPRFGTIDIIAPPGGFAPGPIEVTLPRHQSERWGAILSFASLTLLAALWLAETRRRGAVNLPRRDGVPDRA